MSSGSVCAVVFVVGWVGVILLVCGCTLVFNLLKVNGMYKSLLFENSFSLNLLA